MRSRQLHWIAVIVMAFAPAAFAQDPKAAWLEAQGLEAVDSKNHQEFDAVVARAREGKEERAIIF
jgi:hypothetical protein